MAKNVEIELKLVVGKRDLKKLLASDMLQGVLRPGSEKQRRLVSSYYDTEDLSLKQHGIAYRVRDKGDGTFEATVKTDRQSSSGLSERLELNLPLTKDEAVLEGFAALGLGYELTELAGEGVEKLFTVEVMRTTYLLDLPGAVAELAIDNGKIFSGKDSDPIDELELELVEGEVGALLQFAAELAELVPVFTEKRSKFARGLALRGIASDLVTEKMKLAATGNARLELLKAVQQRGDSLLALQNQLKKSVEADVVKQLVKELQYLRCYLDFGKVFAPVEALEKATAWAEKSLEVAAALQGVWKLQKLWASLVEQEPVLENNVLAKHLLACEEEARVKVQKLAAKGSLSVLVYNAVAWLHNEAWQNEAYLEMEGLTRCRLHDWQEELDAAEASAEKLQLLDKMLCLAKSMQGKGMSKLAEAKKKERRKVLAAVARERAINLVQSLSKNSNSRVLNRDAGVVIGYLLRD